MVTMGDGAEDAGSLLFRAVGPAEEGQVYALCDVAGSSGEPPAGTVVTRPGAEEGTVEVCFVTVAPGRQGCELGGRLLAEVGHALLATGARRLVASAESTDADRIELLRRAGFRPTGSSSGGSGDRRWFTRDL